MAEWLNTAFAGFDRTIFEWMYRLRNGAGGFFDPFFKSITFLGESGWLYIVASIILLFFKKTRKIGVTILASIAVGALITNIAIKNLVSRPRPFTANSFYYDCWNAVGPTIVGKNSFPSGHATGVTAATVGWILSSKKKWRYFGIIFAVLMGLSRIYLFVHYPTDVIAGFIVGTCAAICGYYIVKLIYKVLENNRGKKVVDFVLDASVCDLIKSKKEN